MKQFFTLMFLIPIMSFAQLNSFQWGELQKEDKKSLGKKIICEVQGKLYVVEAFQKSFFETVNINNHQPNFSIQIYDVSSLKLINTVKLEIPEKMVSCDVRVVIEDVLLFGNKVVVLLKKEDKKSKNTIYYLKDMESNTTLNKEWIEVISLKGGKSNEGLIKKVTSSKISYEVSKDGSKMAFVGCNEFVADQEEKLVKVHLMGNDFKTILEKQQEVSSVNTSYQLDHIKVSNKGTVYIVGRITTNSKAKKGATNSYVTINEITSSNVLEYQVSVGTNYIGSVGLAIEEKIMRCDGVYSKLNGWTIGGYFSMTFKKGEPQSGVLKTTDLTKDFASLMRKQEKKRRLKAGSFGNVGRITISTDDMYELGSFDFKGYYPINNEGAYLVFEKYYRVEKKNESNPYGSVLNPSGGNSSNVVRYDHQYFYGDILVFKISKDGDPQWFKVIPKHQVTSNDFGKHSSFVVFQESTLLNFLFNDNAANLERIKEGKKLKSFKGKNKGNLVKIELTEDGVSKRNFVLDLSDEEFLFNPQSSYFSEGKQTLFSIGSKDPPFQKIKFKVGKITF